MNIFGYLKEQLSIVQIVNEYTTLKKSGTHWSCCCPFHHEKTASCMVNEEKGIFYCFGCHAGGDLISFVAKIENCTPIEAAHHIIAQYNLELPAELSFKSASSQGAKNKYQAICEKTAEWCHQHLLKTAPLKQYLKNRGFDEKSLSSFTVGYFPGGLIFIKEYIEFMKKEAILVDDLLHSHLLFQGKTVLYSPFEDRIIFPIYDHMGAVCGFGGRIYKPEDTRPKYYNSRENEYFNKGSLLFGFDKAKKAIQQTGSAFLVEGYTDCIAMVQHGFSNTVATLGTACSLAHLKTLARYTHELYVMYDADVAGREAVLRLTELCWQVNLDLWVVSLPKGEDPASLLTKNIDITPFIKNKKEVFSFYIDTITDNFSALSLSHKMRVAQSLLARLKTIQDPIKQDLLTHQAAKTLEIPFQTLRTELKKNISIQTVQEKTKEPAVEQKRTPSKEGSSGSDRTVLLENKVLSAILQDMRLFNINSKAIEHLIDHLPTEISGILRKLHTMSIAEKGEVSFIPFYDLLNEHEQHYTSRFLLSQDFEKIDEITFKEMLTQLQKKYWQRIIRTLKADLSTAQCNGDTNTVQSLLNKFIELKQSMSDRLRG